MRLGQMFFLSPKHKTSLSSIYCTQYPELKKVTFLKQKRLTNRGASHSLWVVAERVPSPGTELRFRDNQISDSLLVLSTLFKYISTFPLSCVNYIAGPPGSGKHIHETAIKQSKYQTEPQNLQRIPTSPKAGKQLGNFIQTIILTDFTRENVLYHLKKNHFSALQQARSLNSSCMKR